MERSINHRLFFNQAPAEVWEYLTRPELIELWLMKSDIKPLVGHEFQFRTNPLPQFNFDGIINCKVLEVIPFKKLSYSWKGGNNGKVTLDSIVVWTLLAKDGGTELELVHTGFDGAENLMMYTVMNDGWLRNMQKIPVLINEAKQDNQ